MAGNCALFFGSNIGLDPCLEFLPWAECHYATRADGDLFAGLGIAPGTLVLVAQIEVAETGELHLLTPRQRGANFLEEEIHQLTRFALIEPQLVEQGFRHLRLGQGHFFILESLRSSSHANPSPRKP